MTCGAGTPTTPRPKAWRDLLAEMEKAVAVAERYDVALGIEPELANVVTMPRAARRLLDELASPRLASCSIRPISSSRRDADERRRLVEAAVDPLAASSPWHTPRTAPPTAASRPPAQGVIDFAHFIAACVPRALTAPSWPTGSPPPRGPAVAALP